MTGRLQLGQDSSAGVIARMLKARGVDRVFGLCGGHIMPIWMRLVEEGIQIVDVHDERAAVYMAHAYGVLRRMPGVALVTAGPGVTNAMTGVANADKARAAVVVLSGVPPRAQLHKGALQDLDHVSLLKGITRLARTVYEPEHVPETLDMAWRLARGDAGQEPGPVFLDFPTDTLRSQVPHVLQMDEYMFPDERVVGSANLDRIQQAAALIRRSSRPLVIGGRGARDVRAELQAFLRASGALFLDTGECKGVLADSDPALVTAVRAQVMGTADLVITIGRQLDFQLAYGSPAVFKAARWIRIADNVSELHDNRRGNVELFGSPSEVLKSLTEVVTIPASSLDKKWRDALQAQHANRVAKLRETMATSRDDADERMHPNRLLSEVQRAIGDNAIVVADGGDFLAFVRVAIRCDRYLDPGPLGCIGIGTPFGIGAALACPDQRVVVLTGDGAFGFDAMEVDTAVRHEIPILLVIANNGAWQIEVHDQADSYGKVAGTSLQYANYAAMARALGAHGERVEHTKELSEALGRALAAIEVGRPAVLDVLVSSEPKSSDAKSGLAVVPDLQPLSAWDEAERNWRLAPTV